MRVFAANLLSPDESDVGMLEEVGTATEIVRAGDAASVRSIRDYWPELLLAALAIIMLEWWVYNKKVYI